MRNRLRSRLPPVLAAGLLLGACGGDGGGDPTAPRVSPNQAPTVTIRLPSDDTLWNQVTHPEPVDFSAAATDPEEGRLPDEAFEWMSSVDGSLGSGRHVAGWISNGDHEVVVTAVDSAGASGSDTVRFSYVENHPPEIVSVTYERAGAVDSFPVTFHAEVRDPEEEIPDERISWVSTVDEDLGTGRTITVTLSGGEHRIRVSAQDRTQAWSSDSLMLAVEHAVPPEPARAPRIDAVRPDTLRPGGELHIVGRDLSGVELEIFHEFPSELHRSDTLLSFTVPDRYCLPAGLLPLDLTWDTASHTVFEVLPHPYAPAEEPLSVTPGELVPLGGQTCLVFPPGTPDHEYLLGIQYVSEVASATTFTGATTVVGTGRDGNGWIDFEPAGAIRPRPVSGDSRAEPLRPLAGPEASLRRWEARNLDPARALRGPAAADTTTVVVTPGQSLRARVPGLGPDPCTAYHSVTAEIVSVGEHFVIAHDVDGEWMPFSAERTEELLRVLEERAWPVLETYFGEATDIDGNGRIVVLVSPAVNRNEGVLGFVFSGDFFDRSECQSSDEGEIVYLRAPDAAWPPTEAYPRFFPLLAHELTHVIQMGRRLQVPGVRSLASVWEAEGQASFGEEIVGREILGLGQAAELGADAAFSRDARGSAWLEQRFVDLARYFGLAMDGSAVSGAPHACTWLEVAGPCEGGRNVYGTPWSLLRWLTDHHGPEHPGGPPGLHRALIEHPGSGFATLEEVVGVPIEELLAGWAASLVLDGRGWGGDALLGLPSWDLAAVMEQLPAAGRPRAMQPIEEVDLRAGSTAYFGWGGRDRSYSISIGDAIDPVPRPQHESVRIWLVRRP